MFQPASEPSYPPPPPGRRCKLSTARRAIIPYTVFACEACSVQMIAVNRSGSGTPRLPPVPSYDSLLYTSLLLYGCNRRCILVAMPSSAILIYLIFLSSHSGCGDVCTIHFITIWTEPVRQYRRAVPFNPNALVLYFDICRTAFNE